MAMETVALDQLQSEYKAAVEHWIETIRAEEALASVNHSVAQIDAWEHAGEAEEQARTQTKAAKRAYEDALREEFFHF